MGFVGSHLTEELLKHKHKIIIISKGTSKKKNILNFQKKIQIEIFDILNFKKLEKCIDKNKPDVIIHLAGITSHSKSFENPILDIDSNAKSTLFILEKIRRSKLPCRFILGSTFIVIGKPQKLPVNELTPCNPTTLYGANRLASEHYCKIYNSVYGIDTVIFRITNSFGPREQIIPNKNAVNFLIHEAYSGRNITIFNDGNFYRDLIYIDDVVSGIYIIMKKGKSGNLYWISSGKKIWFYQLGHLLEKLTNTKVKYVKSPTYTRKVDVGNFVVDNKKLRQLGWTPKVSLKNGILNTLNHFKISKINF